MHLHSDPSLAEVPDFPSEQLESLTRSVQKKQKRLEQDIQDYIRRKQAELSNYEQEVPLPCSVAHTLIELIGLASRAVPFNGMRRVE